MDVERLVDDYIKAWNRQDIAGLLQLMDKRTTYYDAYWMEYCVGRYLPRYLQHSFEEQSYSYKRIGDVLMVDDSAVYRYTAHEVTDSNIGPALFNGAEVLTFRDNKIVTVSDYYCNPDPTALEEVARLAVKRHGETRHAQSGLGALTASRFRGLLSDIMGQDQDQVYLNANLTQSQLASRVGCSVSQLSEIIDNEYGTNFHNFVDQHRARHARTLLLEPSEDPDFIDQVAVQSGFRSIESFNSKFRMLFGESPVDFHHSNAKKIDSANKSIGQ
jgi:AraC-like DNA-binding protein